MNILKFFTSKRHGDCREKYLSRTLVTIPKSEHKIPLDKISRNAISVVERLQKSGHKAYLVGGCVRDLLIGRSPKDFDVVSSATPTVIKHVFGRARIIGRRFKIVHIPFGQEIIETATFRALPDNTGEDREEDLLLKRDNEYGNEREDAIRRDFTINALFFDPVKQVILDYVGGYQDLKQGIIRIIGNPNISYREDPVRMIRAVKFQATTGFSMEKTTLAEIGKLAEDILKCSTARVIEEIYKIMRSGVSLQTFRNLIGTSLIKYLIPKIHEMLAKTPPSRLGETPLGQRLTILDELTRSGRKFNNVLYLSIIFYDLIHLEVEKSEHPDMGYIANNYLTEISRNMGFSRRDKDLMVKVVVAQSRFANPGKRSRQFVNRFLFRDYFKDSLDFYEINGRVLGTGTDDVHFWVKQYKNNLNKIQTMRQEERNERRESNHRGRSRGRRGGTRSRSVKERPAAPDTDGQ